MNAIVYRIRHRTQYRYTSPVATCQNQLRMRPRKLRSVEVHQTTTTITPSPDSRETHEDYFGNQVESFAIESLHNELIVDVESQVSVSPHVVTRVSREVSWRDLVQQLRSPAQSQLLDVAEFSFESPRVTFDDSIRKYAMASFDKHESLADAAIDLTRRIHKEFRYDTTATNVGTSVDEAFGLRAGVCQDFAHIQIACLRSIGLAARYVSGYLRTYPPPGKPRLVGADQSHAWLSVFVSPELGWMGLDPTNGNVIGQDHIPICFGRDYLDVAPMRGVALGGGTATLKVSVDVAEVPHGSRPS